MLPLMTQKVLKDAHIISCCIAQATAASSNYNILVRIFREVSCSPVSYTHLTLPTTPYV